MKKTIALFVALASFSCSKAQKKEFSNEALAEKVTAMDGSEVSFQSVVDKYKGKTVVLEFWASWCGDCVKAMPKIKELQQNNPDVVYVFFSCDKTFDKWKEEIEKHELKGDHYLVKEGYSLSEIEEMDTERYDYLIWFILEKKNSGQDNPLSGGI